MRIEFHDAGFRELRTSGMANALLDEMAEPIEARANAVPSTTSPAATEPYYETVDASDAKRARRRIRTRGARAGRHEAKTQALQRGLSG